VAAAGLASSAADDCALEAFRSGAPFWVGHAHCGTDGVPEITYLVSDGRAFRTVGFAVERGGRSSRFGPAKRVTHRECTPVEIQVLPGRFRLACRDAAAPASLEAGCDLPCAVR